MNTNANGRRITLSERPAQWYCNTIIAGGKFDFRTQNTITLLRYAHRTVIFFMYKLMKPFN